LPEIIERLKNAIKKILQSILGFDNYLRVFAKFKIKTLSRDPKEGDFFAFMDMLPDRGVILDIGANIGIMTWHLVSKFKHAKVKAFEPIPENFQTLESTLSDLPGERYELFDFALGDESGSTTMVLPEVDSVQMQGLSHVVHESITDFNEGKKYEVKVHTLDEFIPVSDEIVGIKLDVENFEYYVLKGGENLLRKHRPIIYTELWENENRQRCFDFLSSLDYAPHFYDGEKLKAYSKKEYKGQNFFFIPKDK
jgi:FkbM family methyltransferase